MIDKILTQLMYNPHEPMIFSSGLFLVLFLGFTFVYMLLQRKLIKAVDSISFSWL